MQPVLIGIGVYLLVQFAFGLAVSRRIASENDYLIAGRRLGVGLAAFSIFATWFGAETVVGAAGAIYSDGLAGGSADPFGYGLCLVVLGVVVAAPLWRRRYTTFGDLFRDRYSIGVERLAVLLMVPTSVLWAAAQIRAFGQVVSASSDLTVNVAITVAASFVIVYTVAGGLLADVVTDFVQSIAVIVGLLVLLVAVANANGGFVALTALVETERIALFSTVSATPLEIVEAWAVPVCGSLLAVELLSRILGCKSAATARDATLIGAAIYVTIGLVPVLLGLAGPALVPGLDEPEQLVAVLAQRHLSTFLYVLFAGALISAILSTVDSCLLAAASLVSHNLIVPLRPTLGERGKILSARLGVVAFGLIAYTIALNAEGIYELVATASAFGSAGIFVVGLFGLFGRIGAAASAYAALTAGVVVWAAGEYWLDWSTPYLAAVAAALTAYLAAAALAPRRLAATR
ncbi:MAG TPA: sodium:solute symporter family protein [Gammaproteobacteria bacterium]|nr:sodium:solute symporter family protein [Gammaproteobacteria bacterium]